jgi:SAM-dependent methyltransferase
LIVIAASFQKFDAPTVEGLLNRLFGRESPLSGSFGAGRANVAILHPRGLVFDMSLLDEKIAYEDAIGLETNQEIWRPLRDRSFAAIFVLGCDRLADFEEIILACYLNGGRKLFVDPHGMHDIAPWQEQVRPNLSPREVRAHRLAPDVQREYFRTLHRWLVTELIQADLHPPTPPRNRSPELCLYSKLRLAVDLAQQTSDLQREEHGESFSIFRCLEGSIVHSSDFYRSMANFVMAVEGVDKVLDVGCGSGFLASYLAASGRYKEVIGTDASAQRVDGARLYAELNGSRARFETTSMTDIRLPDASVDVSVTSFALEQTGEHLARCFSEIRRVTRKLMILFEPSNEFFATLPSLWHVPKSGWANQYHATLVKSGLSFAVRPNLFSHYFNPGAVFLIDLESTTHPCVRYPQLFGPEVADWPGGTTLT